jgi:hypothetical protein
MTATMMMKVTEAKAMVAALCEEEGKVFTPTTYEQMRYYWEAATPTWATLKKYASEIGLVTEDRACAWHSDGSLLASLCGIAEGTIFHYTVYRFE